MIRSESFVLRVLLITAKGRHGSSLNVCHKARKTFFSGCPVATAELQKDVEMLGNMQFLGRLKHFITADPL